MTDRTTKILLGAIAIALWTNLAFSLFRPTAVVAQGRELSDIQNNLASIANGVCYNQKICG
jgi:hypothetical protein